MKKFQILVLIIVVFLFSSCLKHRNLYQEKKDVIEEPLYIYPFSSENQGVTVEMVIQTKAGINMEQVKVEIPPLKYNKSWLFILSQDDCKQASYCCTWAALNGRPLSKKYYYDVRQYLNDDLPPDVYTLGKTLGSTDGAGNEVRFNFTTTLAPEWDFMNAKTVVSSGFSQNYYRFFMKSGLVWDNVREMVNYGTGIAFHDVNTEAVNVADSVLVHYASAQDSILKYLSGRRSKVLAEPNGNKTYITAAQRYAPIQIMTAQTQAEKLFPFQVKKDLRGVVLNRNFSEIAATKEFIESQLKLAKEEREAVCVGVHGTGTEWVEFFLWLNDQYGKDGDDSLWFTSLEEYYEYNYYRIHGIIKKVVVDEHTLKLIVTLPAEENFYYPSVTLNLEGMPESAILSVSADDNVKGLSYASYEQGTMLHIDCRKKLVEHATHFVEQYEKFPTEINRRDAVYFTALLKNSPQKEALLKRIK